MALALVSVSLLTMAILGAFAYTTSASLLQEISIRQLNALVESKKRDLEKVQDGWRDQLRLIASRTQLRASMKQYTDTGDKQALGTVSAIISDAASAVDDIDRIRILSMKGEPLASVGDGPETDRLVIPNDPGVVSYEDTIIRDNNPVVIFSTLLVVDKQPVGVIEATFNTAKLRSVTDNYTGLGKSGEVLVAMRQDASTVQLLNPQRHSKGDRLAQISKDDASSAIVQSLSPNANQNWLNSTDYRGVKVWAATRFLPEVQWGLVVKVDEAEEEVRARSLKDELFDIALALSAFAIIGGTALGFYLARPIHELAMVVERIRHGETELRADTSGDDEIAYLAESLNELMDHMQSDQGKQNRS